MRPKERLTRIQELVALAKELDTIRITAYEEEEFSLERRCLTSGAELRRNDALRKIGEHVVVLLESHAGEIRAREFADPTEVVKEWIDKHETEAIRYVGHVDDEFDLQQALKSYVFHHSGLADGYTMQADWDHIGIHYWHGWGLDD